MTPITTTVKVFGVSPDWEPLTKKQCHRTQYVEWAVPKPIYKKLCKMMGKEIKKFHKTCKCERCVKDRKK
jgi:hypothetical protein